MESIEDGLGTNLLGHCLVCFEQIDSTNNLARRLARAGAPEGTLVLADHQTAGRGRLERSWEAPPGTSLLLSLIFRPPLAPAQIQRLTMACGLAVVEAVEAQTNLALGLKWPNDLVAGAAKVGGMLTEVEIQGEAVAHVVVGIGLNVNLDPQQLPPDLLLPATSLSRLLGRSVPRRSLLQELLRRLELRYAALLQAGQAPHAEWAARLVTLGRAVVVSGQGEPVAGVAEGVDADGALLVRLADGRQAKVLAGDVTLRRSA